LNGQKATYYEGGIRIPFLMQWTGRIKPGQVKDDPVISLDIARTFAAAAGADTQSLEGVDLLPFATGKAKGRPHEMLCWRAGRVSAIRKGDWKLLQMGDTTKLFNLAADIGEKNDLAASKPDTVAELRAAYDKWNQGNAKPLWQGFEPAIVNGEIRRRND
jgi:arylsulfatase A-like enzyme